MSTSPPPRRPGHAALRVAPPPDLPAAPGAAAAPTLPGTLLLCVAAVLVARPLWWSFNYVALLAVAAVLVTLRRPRLRLADGLALATAGWAGLGVLWSARPDLALPAAYRYASVCLLFVACRHVLRRRRDLLLLGYTYLAACTVVAVEVAAGAAEQLRAQGQLLDPGNRFGIAGTEVNATAYTLVTAVVVALALAVAGHRRPLPRLLVLPVAALLVYGILLTGSRGALIGVLLGGAMLLGARFLPRVVGPGLATVAPVLIALVPFGLLPQQELTWLDELYGRPTGDLSGRLEIWPHALSTWAESLLTGSGAGVFIDTNPYGFGPHNLLLTLGNDLGLIGALVYFGAIGTALLVAARTGPTGRMLACGFTGALLPIWLTGQWETSLATWLVLALLTVLPMVPAPAGTPPVVVTTSPVGADRHRRPTPPRVPVPSAPTDRPVPTRQD